MPIEPQLSTLRGLWLRHRNVCLAEHLFSVTLRELTLPETYSELQITLVGKSGSEQNMRQNFCSTCLIKGEQPIWFLYSSGTKQRSICIRLDTQSLKENDALLGTVEIRDPPTLVLSVLLWQDIAHRQLWKWFASSVNAEVQMPWSHGMTASSASSPQLTAS